MRPDIPYEIKIENDGAKSVTRYYGVLTSSEMHAAYVERFSDVENIKKYEVIVSDFTDVTKSLLEDLDIPRHAAIYKQAASYNPNVVIIGIMPTDIQFGLGRMWEAHVFEIPWTVKIFRTRKEAQAFLDEITTNGF